MTYNIARVEIVCTFGRNEIATVIHHEVPEKHRLNDRDAEGTTVTITSRRFTAYAACPEGTARDLERDTRRLLPSVPVTLAFA